MIGSSIDTKMKRSRRKCLSMDVAILLLKGEMRGDVAEKVSESV
jgi:hypothetical protein